LPLWLPSAIAEKGRHCDLKLSEIEWKLRQAQANEALEQLRQQLRLKSHLVTFKKEWITGQRANTRSQTIIKAVQAKIDATAEKYSTARTALGALAIPLAKLDWGDQYPVLNRDDIRCMAEGLEETGNLSEGRRLLSVSWIWKAQGAAGITQSGHGSGELQEGKCMLVQTGIYTNIPLYTVMRIEWCKARARANRWAEEVELLSEEMRRVLAFLTWQAAWWTTQASRRTDLGLVEMEGVIAYAHRQAAICLAMRRSFEALWSRLG
ncbi:hypothetical protein BU15DRAFT_57022, partial [Melanogaster broomeanus]